MVAAKKLGSDAEPRIFQWLEAGSALKNDPAGKDEHKSTPFGCTGHCSILRLGQQSHKSHHKS